MRRLIPIFLLFLLLSGCPGAWEEPLTPRQELAAAEITARVVFDQAVELRLDGFIGDGAWFCIQQISAIINEALDGGEVGVAQSQTRLLRRAARENFNACTE